ncbi:MAG: hypothetical protein ABFE08_11985 [Armatimonadia bacterium]
MFQKDAMVSTAAGRGWMGHFARQVANGCLSLAVEEIIVLIAW